MGEDKDDILILEVYPGEGTYTNYQDNGKDFAYRQGMYNEYRIVNENGAATVEKLHEGYQEYGKIEIRTGEEIWKQHSKC